jgi:hypothetical protein
MITTAKAIRPAIMSGTYYVATLATAEIPKSLTAICYHLDRWPSCNLRAVIQMHGINVARLNKLLRGSICILLQTRLLITDKTMLAIDKNSRENQNLDRLAPKLKVKYLEKRILIVSVNDILIQS